MTNIWCARVAHSIILPILINLHYTVTAIYMIVYRILNSTKAKTTIKNSSAVFFIALPESRILVKLSKNFI